MNGFFDVTTVAALIGQGKRLLVAGAAEPLQALPRGDWIGGTIPYFMTDHGGLKSSDHLFVNELPVAMPAIVCGYDLASLSTLACDHPGHGFTVLLLPGFSAVHTAFAENVSGFPSIFVRPLVGWVTGVALEDVDRIAPLVIDGRTGRSSATEALAMHIELPDDQTASIGLINLFVPGNGDVITFPASGFSAKTAIVNGRETDFAQYVEDLGIDTRLPLVAIHNAAMINVSIRSVDTITGTVQFYAPVFPRVEYRVAAPLDDYAGSFAGHIDADGEPFTFSCNCVLNYVYAALEGRTLGRLTGPMTFGEIAFMLLNQTAVTLTIESRTSAFGN
ncbi:MAG: hypothetical protein P4M00_08360 [Azospirillaceae bacterium]|nr:hypothetical protein [Azospirillaceae bacterium]